MSLAGGTLLGPYEIIGLIGKGGMGEVYRARDTTLEREVAIKVLPGAWANEPERLARFDREARILAALNHPNIATVHGVVEAEGRRALVMELAPGETLTAVIQRGAMSLKNALPVARQIAAALEAAHEKGIVHRDLKPGNVMVGPSGSVKVLDFGLAAMVQTAPATPGNPHDSPTLTIGGTIAGTILGTASYMSPEQAEGLAVDKRADIWSYGVVLWEMLTGKLLFEGSSVSRTLADVLRMEIDFARLPAGTPRSIVTLLRRCLDRDVANRLRDIGEARVAIDAAGSEQEPAAAVVSKSRLGAFGWTAAAALAIVAVALWAPWRKTPDTPAYAFDIYPPDGQTFSLQSQISPDGKRVALVVRESGNQIPYLAIRRLDSLELHKLTGTENSGRPAWSPDSRSLAFVAGDKLKRIEVDSGPPLALTDFEAGMIPFLAWGSRNVILFSRVKDGLWQIPAAGGRPTKVTALDPSGQEVLHGAPQFLPDGRHFLYFAEGAATEYAGSIDAPPGQNRAEVLKGSPTTAYYSRGPSGSDYLMFLRQGALMAQPFDVRTLKLTGEPSQVAPSVVANGTLPAASISNTGALLYGAVTPVTNVQLSWFDRTGRLISHVGQPGTYAEFSLSPDERRLAVVHRTENGADIWLWDLLRGGAQSRFTFDPESERVPVWSAEGDSVVFTAGSRYTLCKKSVNSTGAAQQVKDGEEPISGAPFDWSRDGKRLLYVRGSDLWTLLDGKASAFQQTPYRERPAQFSPDGKWIVYASEETGRSEIWVQTFPASGGKWQISTTGGNMPRWSNDAREIFYLAADGKLMAVKVTLGPSFEYGNATALFQTRIDPRRVSFGAWAYAVSREGRFLVENTAGEPKPVPLIIVTNWWAAIRN